jgi:hypothetical protein
LVPVALAVIEQLEANGAHFRSLRDPIDVTTPQGMFSLQVLGAVAQLERSLIAERPVGPECRPCARPHRRQSRLLRSSRTRRAAR